MLKLTLMIEKKKFQSKLKEFNYLNALSLQERFELCFKYAAKCSIYYEYLHITEKKINYSLKYFPFKNFHPKRQPKIQQKLNALVMQLSFPIKNIFAYLVLTLISNTKIQKSNQKFVNKNNNAKTKTRQTCNFSCVFSELKESE